MVKVSPHILKGIGYLMSTASVILLAIVSWSSASRSSLLIGCLLGGAMASVFGMFCRWLSYEIEKRQEDRRPKDRGLGGPKHAAASASARAPGSEQKRR